MADTEARGKRKEDVPTGAEAELAARIAMLEQRLAELEAGDGMDRPFERLLGEMFPSEVRDHMRAARKEQLLAARSFLDHWIDRLDRRPMPKERRRRESITLE
jgi:hypothetical protein